MKKGPTDDFPYKDLPQVSEIFADGFHQLMFDGQIANITLTSARYDEIKPPKKPSGQRVTAARLVLTSDLLIKLHNQLTQLIAALEQKGMVQREPVVGPNTVQ